MLAYHEATKHAPESLYRSPHTLDWANMPNPYRHYAGVPVVDLPADPPAPRIPALAVLRGERGPLAAAGAELLSQLLFYSASISASKRVPSTGYRYALRVNPSSGNLHPTEFHFAVRGLAGWDDGLYHYRVSAHMAEQRGRGDFVSALGQHAPVVFVLSTIPWREAWKYRTRAYRYCLHDMGHAWMSLALAARAAGLEASAVGEFADDEVARRCGLEDEWPLLIAPLRGIAPELRRREPPELLGGRPNALSPEVVPYALIDGMHQSARLQTLQPAAPQPARRGRGQIALRPQLDSSAGFAEVVRRRRSALDFRGGGDSITFEQLSVLLDLCTRPIDADFYSGYIQLYAYVHRVSGLAPGLYRHWRAGERASDTADPPRDLAGGAGGELECLRPGDQRVMAAALSLSQELAGNSCVTFSMIADLARAGRVHGNRGYRYAHFEAGAIGQRLYIAAEAMGFQSTGIGAFFDDQVHRYLDLEPAEGQVVYHFACGYAVRDERLEG